MFYRELISCSWAAARRTLPASSRAPCELLAGPGASTQMPRQVQLQEWSKTPRCSCLALERCGVSRGLQQNIVMVLAGPDLEQRFQQHHPWSLDKGTHGAMGGDVGSSSELRCWWGPCRVYCLGKESSNSPG